MTDHSCSQFIAVALHLCIRAPELGDDLSEVPTPIKQISFDFESWPLTWVLCQPIRTEWECVPTIWPFTLKGLQWGHRHERPQYNG